jgi:hypothetical protein
MDRDLTLDYDVVFLSNVAEIADGLTLLVASVLELLAALLEN